MARRGALVAAIAVAVVTGAFVVLLLLYHGSLAAWSVFRQVARREPTAPAESKSEAA